MKAVQLVRWQAEPELRDVAVPEPGPNQVLVKVAAAFCAMWPDLPTPTVTTLPRHEASSATARSTSAAPSRAAVRATASASIRSSSTTCSWWVLLIGSRRRGYDEPVGYDNRPARRKVNILLTCR